MRGFPRRPRRLSTVVVVAVTLGLAGPVVLGTSAAEAATCPCSIWAPTATPATPADAGHRGRRGRGQVPVRRGRSGDRRPVLQGRRQHRHAHRAPVDAAGHAAGDRDVHRRDRDRLAAGELRLAGGASRRTPPTSPRTTRRTVATPSDSSDFATAGVDNAPLHALQDGVGRRQRRLPVRRRRRLPDQHLPGHATTGSTSSSSRPPTGHHAADGDRDQPCRRRHRRADDARRHRDVQRAGPVRPPCRSS